eukprot:SAG25_NODE_438_length_8018_cov_7.819800_6_plen_111_part_00
MGWLLPLLLLPVLSGPAPSSWRAVVDAEPWLPPVHAGLQPEQIRASGREGILLLPVVVCWCLSVCIAVHVCSVWCQSGARSAPCSVRVVAYGVRLVHIVHYCDVWSTRLV